MNKVILIGRLVRDPELKFTHSGKAFCNFTIAADRNYNKEKKAEAQQKGQPTADFIRVVVWGKTAENCANYLAKGRMCAVNGSIQTSTFEAADGSKRYSTDVLAETVQFLGGGDKGQASDGFNYGDDFTPYDGNDEDNPF